jgi:hypothetical protein
MRRGRLVAAIGLLLAMGIAATLLAAFGPFTVNQRIHDAEEACMQPSQGQCSQGQCSQQQAEPEMVVDGGEVEYGAQRHLFTVVWENRTGRALAIKDIQHGCGVIDVTASTMSLAPGEKVTFQPRADVWSRLGNARIAFVVSFVDEAVQPKMFEISFRQRQPPRLEPEKIAFGPIPLGASAERRMAMTSISADQDETMVVTGDAESSNDKVTCTVLETRSSRVGTPHPDVFSFRHEIEFVVRANADELGELNGTITVPVRFGNKALEMTIPFDATVVAGLEAKPSRLVFLTRPGDPQSQGELRLYARNPEGVEIEQISCDSPAVEFASKEGVPGDKACMKVLQVTVRRLDGSDVNTEILVRAKVNGQEMILSVPVKLRVVEP